VYDQKAFTNPKGSAPEMPIRKVVKENVHQIEFRRGLCVVVESTASDCPLLLEVAKGSRFEVKVVPYHKGLREVADLYFIDGCVAREVSFAYFTFIEESSHWELDEDF